ncbi:MULTISPECIES: hypothetical protein [unclassified Streptomyces]
MDVGQVRYVHQGGEHHRLAPDIARRTRAWEPPHRSKKLPAWN